MGSLVKGPVGYSPPGCPMVRPFKGSLEREDTFKGLPYSSKGPKEVVVHDLRLARRKDVHKALSPPQNDAPYFLILQV